MTSEWMLYSPFWVRGYEEESYRIDFEVGHNLKDGVMDPKIADLPRVLRIGLLERLDGRPFNDELRLDLAKLAVDGVVLATQRKDWGYFLLRESPDHPWSVPKTLDDSWRKAAQAIRLAAFKYGPQMKWTKAMDSRLIEMYEHVAGCATCTVNDIADELGSTPARIHARLSRLRKTQAVPVGRQGRPPGTG